MDTGERKRVTIDQVAERSGVSKTTVSRYLNHKYENLSEETRARIEQVIRELDYRPNRSAQRLKASRSMLIGCSIGDVSSPFAGLLLKGITRVCGEAGYQVLFADCAEDAQKERLAIEGFLENRVDGLIVNTPGGNGELLRSIHERGTPVVLADRSLESPGLLDTVISEYDGPIRDCVRLLLDCGYTRIALFSETIGNIMPRIQRRGSYLAALRELAAGMEPQLFEIAPEDAEGWRRAVRDFRDAWPEERIAILSINGVTARRLLVELQHLDLETGYKLGLCTFDDWSWFNLIPPGITAIEQQSEELGAQAARLLLERIDGVVPDNAPARSLLLPTRIRVRGSTVHEQTEP